MNHKKLEEITWCYMVTRNGITYEFDTKEEAEQFKNTRLLPSLEECNRSKAIADRMFKKV